MTRARGIVKAVSETVPVAADPGALISPKAVSAMVGLSIRTIRRMVNDGQFPVPLQINQRVIRWVRGDISEWVAAKRATAPAGANIVHAARDMGITFPLRNLSK